MATKEYKELKKSKGIVSLGSLRSLAASFLFLVFFMKLLPCATACGYHDPAQIRIGALNWMYENSLHVNGAIAEAQKEGRLPPPDHSRLWVQGPYREELDAQAFEKTKQLLLALGAVFQTQEDRQAQSGFSMVLVETAMLTRFPASGSESKLEVDADSVDKDDLVVATGEPVVEGLLQGRLSIADALDTGCIRLYGTPEQISDFRATYGNVGGQAEREDPGVEAKKSS